MNKYISFKLLLASLILSLYATELWAWGDLGHEVVGEIAEQLLAKDFKTKDALRAIIGVEPLAMSAVWPDKVKSDGRFDEFALYHFITIYRDPKTHTDKNALTVLQKFPQVISSGMVIREAKMVALRYLAHVVGDIHQPLHVGNEFDRGGNWCRVNWQPDSTKEIVSRNLHQVWDTDLVDFIAQGFKKVLSPPVAYYSYKQLSKQLMEKHKDLIQRGQQSSDIMKWISESNELRQSVVYPDRLQDNLRPYCNEDNKLIKPSDMPLLDKAYTDKMIPIVEKRLLLAGMRLAQLLKNTLGKDQTQIPTEQEILNMLKMVND